jgi:hypothetical protein
LVDAGKTLGSDRESGFPFRPPLRKFLALNMKAPWIVLLAVVFAAALAAGFAWHSESARVADLEAALGAARVDNAKLTSQLAESNEKAQALESESTQLRAARAMAGARMEPDATPTPAPDQSKSAGSGNFFAKMFKDPAMRKLMAAQQAGALRGLYSDFLKQAHLTPDQTDKFFQILQDRQMALMDSGADALSGGKVNASATAAATSTANAALKDLLGPDGFGQYQDFEKTLGARMQVGQLNQQLTGQGMPLQDYQNTALIQIMTQETAAIPKFDNGGALNMSDDAINQYSQQLDAANQRVYNRAMSVLTPPQLSAFATYQKSMSAAQLAGLKMARQMFNGSSQ